MSDKDSYGSFLVGFLVGGLVGAVVALLYAPQSGEETRGVIKDKTIELKDKSVIALEETYHKAEAVGKDAYQKAETAGKEAVTKAQDLLKTAQGKAAETLKKGSVILEGEAEAPKAKK